MIATSQGPFADKDADAELFRVIVEGLADSGIEVVEDDRAVNDTSFARDIAEALATKLMPDPKSGG